MPAPHHTIKVQVRIVREVDGMETLLLADQSTAGPEPVSQAELEILLSDASSAAAEEYGNSI
jgi:hypothetical protein